MKDQVEFSPFSALLANTQQYYYITTDIKGNYTYVNDAFVQRFGFTKEHYIGKSVINTIHPDDLPVCEQAVTRCFANVNETVPVTLRKPVGYQQHYITTYWEFAALKDDLGNIIGMECLGCDVAGSKTQQDLHQLVNQVNTYINGIEDLLVVIDRQYCILRSNKAFAEFTGKGFKALQGTSLLELHAPGFEAVKAALQNPSLFQKQYQVELPLGKDQWGELITFPNPLGTLLVIRNITESLQAKEKLRQYKDDLKQKETWFRKLLVNAIDCVFVCDAQMYIRYATSSTITMLGYEPEELIGQNATLFIHPDDLGAALTAFQEELAHEPETRSVDMRVVKKDGSWLWVEAMGKNRMDDPDIGGMIIYLNDIHLRKRTEEALAQNEKKFRAVVNTSYNGIVISDFPGNILSVNPALCQMFGYTEEEFLSKKVQDFLDFKDPAIIGAMEKLHKNRRFKGEVWATHKNGRKFLVELFSSFLYRDAMTSYYSTVVRDIDEERKAKQMLMKREEILSAVANATSHLATDTDIDRAVNRAMEYIGKALGVDRVYIFEQHQYSATGNPLVSQRYEWCAPHVEAQIDNPILQNIPYTEISPFIVPLLQKQPFEALVNDIEDASLKALLASQQIISILVLPVFIKEQFWGFVGFDDCTTPRSWQTFEKDILQAFVATLAASMERIRAEQQIRESRMHYQVLFDESPLPLISYDTKTLRITNVNQAATRYYGYGKEEFLTLKMPQIYEATFECEDLLSNNNAANHIIHSRHLKKNGEQMDVEMTIQQVSTGDQQLRLLLIKDVTEEKRLQREKELLATINAQLMLPVSLQENLQAAIHLIREALDWDVAELWTPNYDHTFIRLDIYDERKGLAHTEKFYEISSTSTYSFAEFGSRPAYRNKEITWVEDLAESNALIRKQYALEAGFVTHVQVPIIGNRQVIALLYFFHRKKRHKNEEAIRLLNILSSRLAAEIEKRRKEEELDVFFSVSQDAMVIAGNDGTYKKVNPAFCQITGYSAAELTEMRFNDIIHPHDIERSELEFRRILKEQAGGIFENRIISKEGTVKWLEWSTSFDVKEKIIVAAARDITAKKIAEAKLAEATEAIRHSLEENKKILNYSLDIILTFYGNGLIQTINPVCEAILGYSDKEMIGKYLSQFIAETHIEHFQLLINQLKNKDLTLKQFEITCLHKNGEPVQMSWSVHWSGVEQIAFVVARDITRQKIAEEKLMISELRFRSFMNNNPAGAWINDENGVFLFVNNRYNQLCRLQKPIREGSTLKDLPFPQVIQLAEETDKVVLQTGKPLEIAQWLPRGDGSKGYFILYKFPLTAYDGKALVGGVMMDMTEKQMADEEIRRIKNAIDNASDAMIIYDKYFRCIYINKAFEKLFGYSLEQLNDKTRLNFILESKTRNAEILHALRENGTWEGDLVMKNSKQETLYVSLRANTMRNDAQEISSYVGVFTNITDRVLANQRIKETAEKLTNIMESISEGMLILNPKWILTYANPAAEKILGLKLSRTQGLSIFKSFPLLKNTNIHRQLAKALKENKEVHFEEYFQPLERWFALSVYPLNNGLTVYFSDITERRRSQMQLALERELFEYATVEKQDLKKVTDRYLKGLESIFPESAFSLLLLNQEQRSLHLFSAPSLPAAYNQSIEGAVIGPEEGSCGTAAYTGQTVIVEDIATDPKWAKYKHLALPHQLLACWSVPLFNSEGKVFGTFAVYYRRIKAPDEMELHMVQRAAKFMAVVYEKFESVSLLRLSNERFVLATKATEEAVWDWNVANDVILWSDALYTLFGYEPTEEKSNFAFWETQIHPEDKEKTVNSLRKFIRQKKRDQWTAEYRFRRKDGSYAYVLDKGFVLRDKKQKVYRMVGAMQDITQRIMLERKLTEEQVNKQKLMAQVAVEAQEKERAEIGNELHDNVNQLLTTTKLYLELAKTEEKNREELIQRSAKNISQVIHEIRKLSRSLVPHAITDLGMVASINDLIETVQLANVINIRFEHQGNLEDALPNNLKITLFRIIQEQFNNIIKHAYASEVLVSIVNDGKNIHLHITDDGVGFDLKKVKRGIGISNIISRANLVNGKVNIQTQPGKGCVLSVTLPL